MGVPPVPSAIGRVEAPRPTNCSVGRQRTVVQESPARKAETGRGTLTYPSRLQRLSRTGGMRHRVKSTTSSRRIYYKPVYFCCAGLTKVLARRDSRWYRLYRIHHRHSTRSDGGGNKFIRRRNPTELSALRFCESQPLHGPFAVWEFVKFPPNPLQTG